VICAKFGKDLFNISKVIGRKKVAQFFDSQCSTRNQTRSQAAARIADRTASEHLSGSRDVIGYVTI